MATKKKTLKKVKEEPVKKSIFFDIPVSKQINLISIGIIIILGILDCIYFINDALSKNGAFGFPLDDPWIHLTFARNLIEYGSFSYYKNILVTAGSTSPLYTLLLSVLYIIVKNEFIISYILGIGFFGLSIFFFYKLVQREEKENWFPLAAALMLVLQPKLILISVSGMETALFIFMIVLCFFFYRSRNVWGLGTSLGLLIWSRPDGIVVWIAIAIDYLLSSRFNSQNENDTFDKKGFLTSFAIGAFFVLLYFVFNFVLSGSIFPNTYGAKIEFYNTMDRSSFLKDSVFGFFSTNEFVILWIPFLASVLFSLYLLFKKHYSRYNLYILFIVGLIAVYYIKLPFAHRFGRYLLPVIPFYLYVTFSGMRGIYEEIQGKSKADLKMLLNALFFIFAASQIAFSFSSIKPALLEYVEYCKYHNDRHVAAGKWLYQNTKESDVIATHDIGAIAFYSHRKVFDMAGLINPEVVPHLKDEGFNNYLYSQFKKNNVTYLALLKNWFEVGNQKPEFVPVNQPEILEVYKYYPQKTHILDKKASGMLEGVAYYIESGADDKAMQLVNQSIAIDPLSSRAFFLKGLICEHMKSDSLAAEYYKKALDIYPDNPDANFTLGRYFYKQNNIPEAIKFVERSAKYNSAYQGAQEFLKYLKSKQ
jgi:tetratricopeptide (TPR) repeat protein